jgi:peptidoglycan/LPS O-acetylase OafA/YrhL
VGGTGPASASLVRVHRPELQGLRAVAVALVVVYHVWFGRVSGGVDVFFVVSGFLLTGQLARAADRGPLALGRRWSRTLVRLLPCAVVVLVATVAAGMLLLPEGRWPQTLREVVAAALFLENWQLAADTVDYAARSNMSSPVQHFWSLSIQGQFYVIWPALIAAALVVAARGRWSLRQVFTAAVVVVFAVSIAYSVARTATDQRWAYFDTATRMWEFALGALLALALPALRAPLWARVALGWIGMIGLVSCGLILQVSTVFPGYVALWPTGAALLIIVAGTTGGRYAVDRLLTLRPVGYVGDISYSLYLWHWPLLIAYLTLTDRTAASLLGGCAVLTVSLVLAAATTWVCDHGIERLTGVVRAFRRPAVLGVACVLPVVVVAAGWSGALEWRARQQAAFVADPANYPGARVLAAAGTASPRRLPVHPDPADAEDDLPLTYTDKCNQDTRGSETLVCAYGPDRPPRTLALVGDSHAAHWFPALHEVARREGWQVINITKGACPFAVAPHIYLGRPYVSCDRWQEGTVAELGRRRPDLVVTTSTTVTRRGEYLRMAAVRQWRRLGDMGIPVLAIRDTPRLPFRAPECVEQTGRDGCVFPKYASLTRASPTSALVSAPPNVTFADLNDQLCPRDRCPSVIGNVLVYWDSSHFTATYARTMAPALRTHVRRATGW